MIERVAKDSTSREERIVQEELPPELVLSLDRARSSV
jgi:hypothetical protein